MSTPPLSFEEYKLIAEVRTYVTSKPARCKVAAKWLDIAYSFEAIAERKCQEQRRINAQVHRRLRVEPTKMQVSDPRHETFNRLVIFCQDAIKWDLSLFTDEGRDLHAHAILYVSWLITDPEAAQRGLRLTDMERATFEPRTSVVVGETAPTEGQQEDWYMDRDWVRMVVFDEQMHLRDGWLSQVRIAFYEVGLPRPKKRGLSRAELRAAQSYLWAIEQGHASHGAARFTREQHKYLVNNDCPMYRGSSVPKFGTWRSQASRGLPALLARGAGAALKEAERVALENEEAPSKDTDAEIAD